MVHKLGLLQPSNQIASTAEQAMELADEVGYPLVVRPSYVLGGRAMEIVYSQEELARYMTVALEAVADAQMVAVCDPVPAHRERAKQSNDERYKNNDCKAYADYRELLARGDIQGVVIATLRLASPSFCVA